MQTVFEIFHHLKIQCFKSIVTWKEKKKSQKLQSNQWQNAAKADLRKAGLRQHWITRWTKLRQE